MAKIQFERDGDGVHFVDGRQRFIVNTEAAVDLVWGPLFKHTTLAVYHIIATYCAHRDDFRGLGVRKLAKFYGFSPNTWQASVKVLRECKLIDVKVPHEDDRKKGVSTTYILLDPPNSISEELIFKLTNGKPETYECAAPWWMDKSKYQQLQDMLDEDILPFYDPDEGVTPELHPPVSGEGVTPELHPHHPAVTPVLLSGDLRTASISDSNTLKDRPDFPERKITSLDPVASAASQDEQPSTDTFALTGKDEGAAQADPPAQAASETPAHAGITLEEMQAQIKQRQARVAGSITGNFEERIPPGSKASKAIQVDDPRFPEIGKYVIALVAQYGRNGKRELTQQQIADLTTVLVRVGGALETKFTVASLYEAHPTEFRQWVETVIIPFMRDKGIVVSPKQLIHFMHGYTFQGIGFEKYLNDRGIYPTRHAPVKPAAEQPQQPEYGSYDEYRKRFKENKDE